MLTLRKRVMISCCGVVAAISACIDPQDLPPQVSLEDGATGLVIEVGETVRENCTLSGNTDGTVIIQFATGNSNVAAISPLGIGSCRTDITGVSVGETSISVTVSRVGYTGSSVAILEVTVVPASGPPPPPPPACATPTVITDDFEGASNWFTTVTTTTGATSATLDQPTGGNPAGFRFMQHYQPPNSELSVVHLLEIDAKRYSPFQQGAITRIHYAEDRILFNSPYVGTPVGSAFAIRQGQNIVIKNFDANGTFNNLNWTRGTLADLVPADFPGIDFTASGGILTFGYVRSHSVSTGTSTTTQHGIDNFSVTICH